MALDIWHQCLGLLALHPTPLWLAGNSHMLSVLLLPRVAQAWTVECTALGSCLLRGWGTCGAIVDSQAQFVQVSAILHRELVVVGEGGLLAIAHVHTQFIAALGCDPVYVVQSWEEEQKM